MKMSRKTRKTLRRLRRNIDVILKLVFCFPLGLFAMWKTTKWHTGVKIAVSTVIAVILVLIAMPETEPPGPAKGGIVLAGTRPEAEVLGPEAPEEREILEIYAPRRTAIIVEATPTPPPVYVYCNDGGTYYHVKGCKWVGEETPQVTLSSALRVGLKQCPDCDAPAPIG